jgi:hypothetical protein
MPLKSNASSATMLDFQERILEIDEADSHIPTATTTTGMNLILKTRPVKRYTF